MVLVAIEQRGIARGPYGERQRTDRGVQPGSRPAMPITRSSSGSVGGDGDLGAEEAGASVLVPQSGELGQEPLVGLQRGVVGR